MNPEAEASEIGTLLDTGVSFTVPKRSLLRYLGKSERRFILRGAYLRTMDHLSREYLRIEFPVEKLTENYEIESKRVIAEQASRFARIIAIAWLNSDWKIRLFAPIMAYYFSCRVDARKLLQLTLLLDRVNGVQDFLLSTRLTALRERTTAPARVEQPGDTAHTDDGEPSAPISAGPGNT